LAATLAAPFSLAVDSRPVCAIADTDAAAMLAPTHPIACRRDIVSPLPMSMPIS